jgi:hypothetical protein
MWSSPRRPKLPRTTSMCLTLSARVCLPSDHAGPPGGSQAPFAKRTSAKALLTRVAGAKFDHKSWQCMFANRFFACVATSILCVCAQLLCLVYPLMQAGSLEDILVGSSTYLHSSTPHQISDRVQIYATHTVYA